MADKFSTDTVGRRRINDALEDQGTDAYREHRMSHSRSAPISPPMFKTGTTPDYAARRDLERGDYDAAPPISSPSGKGPETGYARGGKVKHGSPTCCSPKYKHR